SELLLASALRLRRGRPDEATLERRPIRLVRRRRRGPPIHRTDEEIDHHVNGQFAAGFISGAGQGVFAHEEVARRGEWLRGSVQNRSAVAVCSSDKTKIT